MQVYAKNVIKIEVRKNMANDDSGDPQWKASELAPMVPTTVTLVDPSHKATGTSMHGEWFLWVVEVENQPVFPKGKKTAIKDYSGKAICFPSKTLREGFELATNGTKEGVKVQVTMVPKKNAKGNLYTSYEVEVLDAGVTNEDTLDSAHGNFINDFKAFVKCGAVKGEKEDFIGFSKTDAYKIPEATVEKLWNVYNEGN